MLQCSYKLNHFTCMNVPCSSSCIQKKRIFTWSLTQSSSTCKTLPYRVRKFLIRIDMEYVIQAYEVNTRSILSNIDSNFVSLLHQEWKEKLLSSTAVAGERCGGNKLRTYKTFKHDFIPEPYVCIITQKKYRSAYAKFRCGVAPIIFEKKIYFTQRNKSTKKITYLFYKIYIHIQWRCNT